MTEKVLCGVHGRGSRPATAPALVLAPAPCVLRIIEFLARAQRKPHQPHGFRDWLSAATKKAARAAFFIFWIAWSAYEYC